MSVLITLKYAIRLISFKAYTRDSNLIVTIIYSFNCIAYNLPPPPRKIQLKVTLNRMYDIIMGIYTCLVRSY